MDLQMDVVNIFGFVFFWKSEAYFKCLFWGYSKTFSSEKELPKYYICQFENLWGAERLLALWNYIDLNFKGTTQWKIPLKRNSRNVILKKVREHAGPQQGHAALSETLLYREMFSGVGEGKCN